MEKKTIGVVVGVNSTNLEDRVKAIEAYINKDIRKRKAQKREVKRMKATSTDPATMSVLMNVDDTDDEQELG